MRARVSWGLVSGFYAQLLAYLVDQHICRQVVVLRELRQGQTALLRERFFERRFLLLSHGDRKKKGQGWERRKEAGAERRCRGSHERGLGFLNWG